MLKPRACCLLLSLKKHESEYTRDEVMSRDELRLKNGYPHLLHDLAVRSTNISKLSSILGIRERNKFTRW